jgi:hypothetical protein
MTQEFHKGPENAHALRLETKFYKFSGYKQRVKK